MILYRDADVSDARALAEFARDTFVETFGHLYPPEDLATYIASKYTPDVVRGELVAPDTRYRLALEGGDIVGYCKIGGPFDLPVERTAPSTELHRLYVATRMKGAGVAKALMDEALAWARARGAQHLYLSVWEDNYRAQAFYRRYGFEHVGEHKFMVGRVADRDLIWRLVL